MGKIELVQRSVNFNKVTKVRATDWSLSLYPLSYFKSLVYKPHPVVKQQIFNQNR